MAYHGVPSNVVMVLGLVGGAPGGGDTRNSDVRVMTWDVRVFHGKCRPPEVSYDVSRLSLEPSLRLKV